VIVRLGLALLSAPTAFLAGSIAWAALTGVIGGFFDSVGIFIPASTYLAFGPAVGALVAVVAFLGVLSL
jgi:hypothetical protein